MFSVAKARLYNGLGFSVPVFTGLTGTLAPPNVLDQNATDYFVAAPPNGSALQIYSYTNSSHPSSSALSGPTAIAVTAYSIPRNANQPGHSGELANQLDTGDNRFVNNSTQVGTSLWQAHTVALGTFPSVRWYEINTSSKTIVQSATIFASATSDDFNASIAATANNDMLISWTSTDTPANIQANIRFSGRKSTDALGTPGGSTSSVLTGSTSPTALTGNFDANFGARRWATIRRWPSTRCRCRVSVAHLSGGQ